MKIIKSIILYFIQIRHTDDFPSTGRPNVSIMSQVTRLLFNKLKSVIHHMKGKIEAERDDAQSGFRQGKGAREGLLNLICQRHLEVHKDVGHTSVFLDYEKAFD